jgi:periplasmic protein TonB
MNVPAPSPIGFASPRTANASGMNPRLIAASAVVVAIHVALLIVLLTHRNDPPPRPIEAKTITASLISPAPPRPVAAPVAIQSTPTPVPPKPVPVKPAPKPKAQPHVKATTTQKVQTDAPSTLAAAAPETPPAPPAPAAPAPAPAEPAAPAIGRPTMQLSAPKDVAHLECNIASPEYSKLAKRRGESGTALVKFVVGLTGAIENIELKKSSGSPTLDQAAVDAMHQSACKPYKENGEAIRVTYTQPFVFELKE